MIVNVFSEFIKLIAEEQKKKYDEVLKDFKTNKSLQNKWKQYRTEQLKANPYLFKSPKIERAIRFETNNDNLTIPVPTPDTSITVSQPAPNTYVVQEADLGGVEETKGEDQTRLQELVSNLVVNNDVDTEDGMPFTIVLRKRRGRKKEEVEVVKPVVEAIGKINSKGRRKAQREKLKIIGEGITDYLPIRRNYPPKMRQIISQVGNETINKIIITRKPINPAIFNTANFLSRFGKDNLHNRFKKMSYDKLYHLAIIITTAQGSSVKIEKNEVLNAEMNPTIDTATQTKQITNLPINLTINEMLKNAEQIMGPKYFTYNAISNNCQDYILNLLQSNNIGDQSDYSFIKQDVETLFQGYNKTKGFINVATTLASIANRLISGYGIAGKTYVVQSIIFNKSKWNLDKAKEWLVENNHKYKKVDDTDKTLRFRQYTPKYVETKGFDKFVTKKLGNSGISFIIVYKK